jgi:hypothetical protein
MYTPDLSVSNQKENRQWRLAIFERYEGHMFKKTMTIITKKIITKNASAPVGVGKTGYALLRGESRYSYEVEADLHLLF